MDKKIIVAIIIALVLIVGIVIYNSENQKTEINIREGSIGGNINNPNSNSSISSEEAVKMVEDRIPLSDGEKINTTPVRGTDSNNVDFWNVTVYNASNNEPIKYYSVDDNGNIFG